MGILLKNGNLITMENEHILYNTDLLIEDGKIKDICKGINKSADKVIDCTDKYIMPGLFDCHVHLNSSEMYDLFIVAGVTSVRNMWGFPIHFEWDKQVLEGSKVGPYIYSTGPLVDGVTYWEGSKIITTPEEAVKAVDEVISEGYLFFKAYPSIPYDAMIKLMEYCKERNFKVCGHLSYNVSARELADLGYYSVEHTNCLPSDLDEVEYLAKSGMWFCPTHVVVKTIKDYVFDKKDVETAPYYDLVSEKYKKEWPETTEWRRTGKGKRKETHMDMDEIVNRGKHFLKFSDKILLGTDAPNPGVTAGFSIYDELESLVNLYGLSNFEALKAGTSNAVRHLNITDKKGYIKKGLDSDILVLEGNPLENISNIKKLDLVIQDKRIYDKEVRAKLLDNAKNIKEEDIVSVY